MKKPALLYATAVSGIIAALACTLAYNTLQHGSRQVTVTGAPPPAMDLIAAAHRLGGAIRVRTITTTPGAEPSGEFLRLHQYLKDTFPRAHAALKREVVNGHSLLYTWQGEDEKLQPMLLMAHQDVVPAGGHGWSSDPFSGEVRDGAIWGRGAWDDKSSITAHFEAIELLLARGFKPRQTIHLAYGHDEETHGHAGALQIAKLLKARGVRPDFVLDEGMVVTEGIIKGLKAPAALVGVAEKGYMSVQLRTRGAPGHSLMPPEAGTGPIARLGDALRRLESTQLPGELRGVGREMFETLAPEMPGVQRIALSNLWLFSPLLERQLRQKPATHAMIRTTTALTVFHAGIKENVLPDSAQATVNFRLIPGDTRDDVLAHVRRIAGEHVDLDILPGSAEATPVSPTAGSPAWKRLSTSIRHAFPGAVVAPGLVLGGTDAKHFMDLTDQIYRFTPVRVRDDDVNRIHGANERISIENYGQMIHFYYELMRSAGQPVH
ncbi:MAG TPA: M20 family peptidase [Ramlibacter sp.]|nr:M20 family peptidase [Ramlibacter sp.]